MGEHCVGDILKGRYLRVLLLFMISLFFVVWPVPFFPFQYRAWFLIPLSFTLSYLLTPLVCLFAGRIGAVDHPDARKMHAHATPLLGGVAVFLAFSFSVVSVFWYSAHLKGVIIGAWIIFIIGALDDLFGLSSLVRLFAQMAAVFVLFLYGMEIDAIPDPTSAHLIKKLVTVVWIIGITNAVNFLDGLDGLCAGFGVIAAFFIGFIAFLTNQFFLMFLSFSLAGSCLGFLPWNFRRNEPAKIFMGDCGSLVIGFILASLAIMGSWAENREVAITVPLLILFLPVYDTSMTTFFRVREGKVRTVRQWLDYVGRDHFHHRVYATGIGKRNAVFVLYALSIMLGVSAVIIHSGGKLGAYLALFQSALILVFFTAFIVTIRNRQDAIARIAERMPESDRGSGDVFGISL